MIYHIADIGRFAPLGSRQYTDGQTIGEHALLVDFNPDGIQAASDVLHGLAIVSDVQLYPHAPEPKRLPMALRRLAAVSNSWMVLTTLEAGQTNVSQRRILEAHSSAIVGALCRLDTSLETNPTNPGTRLVENTRRMRSSNGKVRWQHSGRYPSRQARGASGLYS